jgi:hypothetical protein
MQSSLRVIFLGGFIAGTIDIGAAALINAKDVVFILHAIAGGWLGLASFREGWVSAGLGLLSQWGMSLVIAAIYVAAAARVAILKKFWVAGGLVYGVGIFFVMNYIVVPLSAYHRFFAFTPEKFAENTLAMLLFGLIVSYFAQHSGGRRASN